MCFCLFRKRNQGSLRDLQKVIYACCSYEVLKIIKHSQSILVLCIGSNLGLKFGRERPRFLPVNAVRKG